MNPNTSVQTQAQSLLAAVAIRGKTGKVLGSRQNFTQTGSAKEIKDALVAKNPTLKGKKLAEKVNEVLRGEVDVRCQLGVAWLQASYQDGFVPNVGELRKNTGVLKLVRVDSDEAQVLAKLKTIDKNKALAALGYSPEEIEAMNAIADASKNN
jgi:hypothetical protein